MKFKTLKDEMVPPKCARGLTNYCGGTRAGQPQTLTLTQSCLKSPPLSYHLVARIKLLKSIPPLHLKVSCVEVSFQTQLLNHAMIPLYFTKTPLRFARQSENGEFECLIVPSNDILSKLDSLSVNQIFEVRDPQHRFVCFTLEIVCRALQSQRNQCDHWAKIKVQLMRNSLLACETVENPGMNFQQALHYLGILQLDFQE